MENHSSFAQQTGLAASATFAGTSGSAGAKASFVQSVNINDYSIYALAQVRVVNASQSMLSPELEKPAFDLLKDQGAEAFRKQCGDAFVVGYTTGGELLSLIEITTHSQEEQRQISASIGGSFGVFSGSGEFTQALKKISQANSINVYMYKVGGAGGAVKINPEEMITFATTFLDSVKGDAAYIYRAAMFLYTNVRLPPAVNVIDVQARQDVLDN